ncbi:arsenate reductase (glutaredoxin) [uncultured Muriicola sp.]|uniref:arsenate reductase (glutaredoxin) n=1 Tax=uncultured Muriicola sp. TaxID=1583102 RepID=UPI00262A5EDC|nr:arsenate reductase (glutaredoxin) [uncultured Muriicola sp.]
MIKIYHNPRCRKSREGLALVEASGQPFEIVYYLDMVPSKQELREIIQQLGISPMDLVRTQEAIWKSDFKGKELSEDMILDAMSRNPKLIERPIVLHNQKGVVGRPPEKISKFLSI